MFLCRQIRRISLGFPAVIVHYFYILLVSCSSEGKANGLNAPTRSIGSNILKVCTCMLPELSIQEIYPLENPKSPYYLVKNLLHPQDPPIVGSSWRCAVGAPGWAGQCRNTNLLAKFGTAHPYLRILTRAKLKGLLIFASIAPCGYRYFKVG